VKRGRAQSSLFFSTVCVLCGPFLAQAEGPRPVGIVTAISGEVAVARAASPQRTGALTFRDDLFVRDRIMTQDRSVARVLLGGKALLTIRDRSDLTIREEPRRQTVVDVETGHVAVALVRARMKAGEGFEVRTPNAHAVVRGTVFEVEVAPAPTVVTIFHVIRGRIHVVPSAAPSAPPVSVGAGLSVTVTGASVGKPYASPPLPDLNNLMLAPQHTQSPEEAKKSVKGKQEAKALALTEALALKQAAGEEGGKKSKAKSKGKAVDPVLLDASQGAEVIMKAPPKADHPKGPDQKLDDPRDNVIIPTTKSPPGK
jgi:hypothetical protein